MKFNLNKIEAVSSSKDDKATYKKAPKFSIDFNGEPKKLNGSKKFILDNEEQTYTVMICKAKINYNQFREGECYYYMKIVFRDKNNKTIGNGSTLYRVFIDYTGDIHTDYVETHNKVNFDRIFEEKIPMNGNINVIKIYT